MDPNSGDEGLSLSLNFQTSTFNKSDYAWTKIIIRLSIFSSVISRTSVWVEIYLTRETQYTQYFSIAASDVNSVQLVSIQSV